MEHTEYPSLHAQQPDSADKPSWLRWKIGTLQDTARLLIDCGTEENSDAITEINQVTDKLRAELGHLTNSAS